MATIAGRLNRSWFGKLPLGLRWLLVLAPIGVTAFVAIMFTVASSANTPAQAPIAAPPAGGPAAQAAPPAAPFAQQAPAMQTLQLTPVQQEKLYNQLDGAFGSAVSGFGKTLATGYRSTPQAAEKMYLVQDALRTTIPTGAITAEPFGPITRDANGVYNSRVRVKNVQSWNGRTVQRDITLYFTLDANNELKQVVDMK